MAHDVFISHSAKNKPTADAVCATLESQGIRCWIAPRDVIPGMEWGECIIEAIEQARVMLLVFTADANASPQIRREVERAVNHGVAILPVRMEDVMPARALEYFIGNVHWLDAITPPLEAHLKNLAATIKILLARMERPPYPMPHAPAAPAHVEELAPALPAEFKPPAPAPASPPPPAPAAPAIAEAPAVPARVETPQPPAPPMPARPPQPAVSVPPAEQPAFGFHKLEAVEFPKFDPPSRPRMVESRPQEISQPPQPVVEQPRKPEPQGVEPRKSEAAATPAGIEMPSAAPASVSDSTAPLFAAIAGAKAKPAHAANPRRTTFLLLFLLNLVAYLDFILPSGQGVRNRYLFEFHLSSVSTGELSSILAWLYLFAALVTGWLVGRTRRKPLVVGAAVLFGLGTLLTSFAATYFTLLASQALTRIGVAAFDVLSISLLADSYPDRDRARIFAIYFASIPLGLFLSFVFDRDLLYDWGMTTVFLTCAIPALILAALYGLMTREPEPGSNEPIQSAPRRNLRGPAFLTAALGAGLLSSSSLIPALALRNVFRGGLGPLGAIAILAGITLGGWLAQRWLRANPRALYLLSACGVALALPFDLLAFIAPSDWVVPALAAAMLFVSFHQGPLFAAAANAVSARFRTLAIAIFLVCSRSLGPLLVGWIESAVMGGYHVNNALGAMMVLLALGGVALFIGARFAPPLAERAPTADAVDA